MNKIKKYIVYFDEYSMLPIIILNINQNTRLDNKTDEEIIKDYIIENYGDNIRYGFDDIDSLKEISI